MAERACLNTDPDDIMTRKSKMVSFRVSPHEYDKLREACVTRGAGSVSELARAALGHIIIAAVPASRSLDEQLQDLRDRVQTITLDIDRLARSVDANSPRVLSTSASG
jgi:hypothetical protein